MILIVDDNPDNSDLLAELLHMRDVPCACVNDPLKAMQAIESLRPTLLILDQSMPIMNGTDLLKIIRDTPSIAQLPVIFYSAAYDGEAEGRRLGALRWILKGGGDLMELQDELVNTYQRYSH